MNRKIKSIYNKLYGYYSRLEKHHTFMLASALSFNIILYLIPLFLVIIFIVSRFIDPILIGSYLQTFIKKTLPNEKGIGSYIDLITNELGLIVKFGKIFGGIGIFLLLWLSSALISSLRYSLSIIFHLEGKSFFLIYRLKDILLTLIITILITTYSILLPIFSLGMNLFDKFFPHQFEDYINRFLLFAVTIIFDLVFYYFIYRFVPNKNLNNRVALFTAILCTIISELSRKIFTWYVVSFADYGKFYGTYAIVVSIFIWIYYSSLILLICAELGSIYKDRLDRKLLIQNI